MINVDFCVPGNATRKQIDLSSLIRAWGPSYNGPGANYISVVVSNDKLEDLLQKLVLNKVALRVLVRTIAPGKGDTSLLIQVDPPAVFASDWRGAQKCTTCNAMGHTAYTCIAKVDTMCYACGEDGHTSADPECVMWSSMDTCEACGKIGHAYYLCQERDDAAS